MICKRNEMRLCLLFFASVLLILLACADRGIEPLKQRTNTFPLTTGSRWHYYQINWDVPFNDSTYQGRTDTTDIIRRVIGPDSLSDSLNCVVVDDTSMLISGEGDVHFERRWWGMSDNRFKEYGWQWGWIGHVEPPLFYQHPHVMLDLPLEEGKSWGTQDSIIGGTSMKVLGPQTITAAGRTFDCDVVGMFSHDWGLPDSFPYRLWYCNDGLIAIYADFGVQYIRDERGNIIDSVTSYQRMELLDINIVRPRGAAKTE